jgi:hypothetical protein
VCVCMRACVCVRVWVSCVVSECGHDHTSLHLSHRVRVHRVVSCDAPQVRADLPWSHHIMDRVRQRTRSAAVPAIAM